MKTPCDLLLRPSGDYGDGGDFDGNDDGDDDNGDDDDDDDDYNQ